MAISFTNIWQSKVLDVLISFIRAEFKTSLSVYLAEEYEPQGNCSIRLFGSDQSLVRHDKAAFTNEYFIDIVYYLSGSNLNEKAVEKMYRDVYRLEQLLWDKNEPTKRTSVAGFYGGRVENISINEKTDAEASVDNLLTARIEYVCNYSKV